MKIAVGFQRGKSQQTNVKPLFVDHFHSKFARSLNGVLFLRLILTKYSKNHITIEILSDPVGALPKRVQRF